MVDGLKNSSCLRKTFACVFKNVLFLCIAILDLDLAFLGTRSWYTDEVVLFVHVFRHSYTVLIGQAAVYQPLCWPFRM